VTRTCGNGISVPSSPAQSTSLPASERWLARPIFSLGGVDSDFADWGTDVPGEAKPETQFEVFEQDGNGTFAQIFGAFGVDLDKLCWSQDQIITFVESHANLLHPKGWATFFLFRVGEELFVAHVYRRNAAVGTLRQLEAYVSRLSCGHVWSAKYRHRFVVPQQTS